jgi:NAD(P)H dehydrogenase (quinone)
MKHAVIYAHPNPDSFTACMAASYAVAARSLGHEVVVRDLYAMDFDPRLSREELPGETAPRPRPDVLAERKLLSDVKVFAIFYPFWFNAPPGMLKGYVDRVFGMGFGYGRGMEALLEGRKLISFTSSGAPMAWVRDTGAWRAVRKLFDEHFAEVCGLDIVDHLHFGEITPGIRKDAVEGCARQVAQAVRQHFGETDSAAAKA